MLLNRPIEFLRRRCPAGRLGVWATTGPTPTTRVLASLDRVERQLEA